MNDTLNINFYMGNKTPLISISVDNIIKSENINQFLTHYKFSKWKKGRFFLKRLIKKVFKKRSLTGFSWDNNFWGNIVIHKMESKIQYNSKLIPAEIEASLNSSQSSRRMKNILNYKLSISNNIDMGSPLYIKGSCINALGGDVPENALYQLDGSRRLMAYLLNETSQLNIWIISPKTK